MSLNVRTEQQDEDESGQDTGPDPDRVAELAGPEIDRSPGSGSLSRTEAWVSQSAQSRSPSNDGRYGTRTTFYYTGDSRVEDGSLERHQQHRDPADRRSWTDLSKWNDGMYATESRGGQNWQADIQRWIETFASQLDLNAIQTDNVRYVIDDIDIDEATNSNTLNSEVLILAAISMVVDADTTSWPDDDWTFQDWIINQDRFQQLMNDIEMGRDQLWEARKLIQRDSDFFAT